MGTAGISLEDIHMNSKDLLEKEQLDAGGFGMVSLCLHKTQGLVVLKTVYTGPQRTEFNASLLEEGKIMRKLKHDRVVKLLGVILEDGNYSLVMEYVHKGSLMRVLKTSTIPVPLKGRFILEIIEGMVYLSEQGLVHKDLKPENILVDNDFHIKIADLGVACFKNWSRLTKEETNRQRKLKSASKNASQSNAGTLFYMAPEHLKSLNIKPVEKSDVYSFGIVLWAIFANKEPYEHGINEEQIYYGITNGSRPDTDEIKGSCPEHIIILMKQCWEQVPENRPTFKEISNIYKPFYYHCLEQDVEDEVRKIKIEYPAPPEKIQRMQSLQIDAVSESPSNTATDQPTSLHSSHGLSAGNVNEAMFAACPDHQPVESCETSLEPFTNLERKLQDEYNYHKYGSRMDKSESQPIIYTPEMREEERRRRVSHDPFAKPSFTPQMKELHVKTENTGPKASPFNKTTSYNHSQQSPAGMPTQEYLPYIPNVTYRAGVVDFTAGSTEDLYGSGSTNTFSLSKRPVPESGLGHQPQTSPAWFPTSLQPEPGKIQPSQFKKKNFTYTPVGPTEQQKSIDGHIYIHNSAGIQIGRNNNMKIKDQNLYVESCSVGAQNSRIDFERTGIFDSTTILSEEHLNLVRENLAKQWKDCARRLGFTNPDIEVIDHDYERDGLKEKVYQMLQNWLMREGSQGTTVGKLARALYGCQRLDLLNALIKMNQR
ncbi:PREDICTED: receptor-interacting serine/threonine-protein kinase 1 isoform X2 [Crocodylus porosus]|uniref:Receptor interacting serine/threonine kinase 1 n=1 Tax=Crocodylus porosus TaxID=8502 RepID=A0A7M4DVV6_CROPO|nr:PREDICTED: receptor-interacting serine/threonine-protein kinase 1 isoform X2 [Crocodylus porosus]